MTALFSALEDAAMPKEPTLLIETRHRDKGYRYLTLPGTDIDGVRAKRCVANSLPRWARHTDRDGSGS